MQHEQRADQRHQRDGVAREVEQMLFRLDQKRQVIARRHQQQRAEHEQKRQHQRDGGGEQRVADRFQPQPVPGPRLGDAVSAVEPDPQALDAVRGKVQRQQKADGERIAARACQHVMYLPCERIRRLARPYLQHQGGGLIGQFLGAEKARERGKYDQEWKKRHQRRQRDMARDRPAVVGQKRIEGLEPDLTRAADGFHQGIARTFPAADARDVSGYEIAGAPAMFQNMS
ncbi:hypothetical protein OCAR_4750 [Afipia carboxidovorans OM5]|nr:hypothetical protein OCAR_4750 [Afipia carboxidovorans OM5]